MKILDTERLTLRHLTPADAAFILELINEPGWITHIGDKGIRTEEGALAWMLSAPIPAYEKFGFGFYAVELREGSAPLGICGLVKRESLDDVDIGFAFLARHWGRGYAREAAAAVLAYAFATLKLERVVAIAAPAKTASRRLLEQIGLRYVDTRPLRGETRQSAYFTSDA